MKKEIQEAIELLKNETAVFEVTRIGDDKYTLTIKSKPENTIKVGDYLIARKPIFENTTLNWNESMDKYDGVIQKCELITRYGNIATGMNGWRFHPGWCEKVSPGDVMKRDNGDIFIFREIIDGKTFHHAFYNPTYDHLSTSKDCSICSKTPVRAIHATNEEAQPLFNALAKNGKKWNKEKMCVEDVMKPKSDEECLRAWGCGEKAINDYMKYSEKYDKVLKELMGVSKEYIDSLNAEKIFSQLRVIADLHESSTPDERKTLKQVIKICKQLLNE